MPARSKRCLLLQPPSGLYRRDDRCQSKVRDQTVQIIFPPIYLASMASALEQVGVECRIVDAPAARLGWAPIEATLEEFQPDLLVLGVTQATFDLDAQAARLAKGLCPGVLTVARGEIFLTEDRKCLERIPELDVVIRGESELPIQEIGRGLPLEEIRGLTYRRDGSLHRTPHRPLLEDLDELPYPARHLLDNSLYRSPETGRPLTVIQAGRGCPATCIFCPAWTFSGHKVRLRSPQNILGELRQCVEQFGIDEFYFNADTFTWDKAWTLELCQAILDAGLKIRWGCNSRVDTIDAERLDWMKRAGCWVIGFGVETGSEETLRLIRKDSGLTLAHAEEAIRLCREAGIRSHAFMVIGFPWETREHITQTVEFVRKLDPDFFDLNIAAPLPGTPLWSMVEKEGLWEGGQASYGRAAIRTRTLSAEQLTRLRRQALWRLYLRPRYIWRTLRNAGPLRVKVHYLRAALRRAVGLFQV